MSRYRGQHGRLAFGPGRKRSKRALAQDITASIRQHAQRGWQRTVEEYTPDAETQALVTALLQQAAA
jgi:hypothetical protein